MPILKSGTLLLASSYILTRAPFSIPYSKKLWTPSFALASSGVSLLLIAAVIQLKLPRDPPGPIESVLLDAGRDSLTVYTIQSLLPHALSVLPDPSKPLTESIRAATVSNLFGKGGVEGVAWGLGWAGLCIYLARMAKGREWSIRA